MTNDYGGNSGVGSGTLPGDVVMNDYTSYGSETIAEPEPTCGEANNKLSSPPEWWKTGSAGVWRPEKIKVGHLDYAVKWMNSAWSMRNERRGEISYIDEEIRILEEMSDVSIANTFLHEIVHAIIYHYDRDVEKSLDAETIAERIPEGIIMVWRDNPEAFAWWSQLLQK